MRFHTLVATPLKGRELHAGLVYIVYAECDTLLSFYYVLLLGSIAVLLRTVHIYSTSQLLCVTLHFIVGIANYEVDFYVGSI